MTEGTNNPQAKKKSPRNSVTISVGVDRLAVIGKAAEMAGTSSSNLVSTILAGEFPTATDLAKRYFMVVQEQSAKKLSQLNEPQG